MLRQHYATKNILKSCHNITLNALDSSDLQNIREYF